MLIVNCNNCGPTNYPVSHRAELGLACDTRKSDSSTCSNLCPGGAGHESQIFRNQAAELVSEGCARDQPPKG